MNALCARELQRNSISVGVSVSSCTDNELNYLEGELAIRTFNKQCSVNLTTD